MANLSLCRKILEHSHFVQNSTTVIWNVIKISFWPISIGLWPFKKKMLLYLRPSIKMCNSFLNCPNVPGLFIILSKYLNAASYIYVHSHYMSSEYKFVDNNCYFERFKLFLLVPAATDIMIVSCELPSSKLDELTITALETK